MQQEESKIRAQLEASFSESGKTFAQFLREALAVMEDNPYIRQVYDDNLLETLFRKLPEEKLQAHFDSDEDFFKPLIEMGQEKGWLVRKNRRRSSV